MAEETKVDEAEKVVEPKESFTKAEADEMIKAAIEETSKTLNATFQKKFDEIKKEKQEIVESKQSYEEETRTIVEQMRQDGIRKDYLAKGIKAYSDAGLPVPDDNVILDMIRVDSDDPLRVLTWNISTISEAKKTAGLEKANEIAKKSGRKVVDVKPGAYDGLTYEEMAAMPNAEFEKIPKDIVDKVSKAAFG
jgi:hypothetical protein